MQRVIGEGNKHMSSKDPVSWRNPFPHTKIEVSAALCLGSVDGKSFREHPWCTERFLLRSLNPTLTSGGPNGDLSYTGIRADGGQNAVATVFGVKKGQILCVRHALMFHLKWS